MATKGEAFAGCTVALVTPFRDGEVDFPALRQLVRWHLDQGTPVISPCGTTGESPTLSHDEHERVIAAVIEAASGRARIMAGTGSNATSEAIRLTKFAARAGADASLQVVPYYNRPTQEGLYSHFARIAEACDVPLVLYNVPGRTGRNLEAATVSRLARVARIVAIKEASGSLDQVSEILLETDLTVLSGDDTLTLPMLALGAHGVVSVAANLVPRDIGALIDAHRAGRPQEAARRHAALFPLCRDLMAIAPNPIPVKTALALLGRVSFEMRSPLSPLDEPALERLRLSLDRAGLMKS